MAVGLVVHSRGQASPASTPTASPAQTSGPPVVYVHYYLWWTSQHWKDKLGSAYPIASVIPPVPGSLDAEGCNPKANYPGTQIVDLPAEGLYDQYQADTFELHVDQASKAGLTGFLVSWQGHIGAEGVYDFKKTPQRGLNIDNAVVVRWDPGAKEWHLVSNLTGTPLE